MDANDWSLAAKPLIDMGVIGVDRVASRFYGRLGARFPIGLNRIDWTRVPNRMEVPCPQPRPIFSDYAPIVAAFLSDAFERTSTSEQEGLVLLGDATDVALRLSFQTLLEHLACLLEWPQDYYLSPTDANWCFNFRVYGDMYFGWAAFEEGKSPGRH